MATTDGRRNNGGHKTAGRKSKAEEKRIRDLTSPYVDGAIEKVVAIMNTGEKTGDQLAAAKLLLEYHFGKPKQQTDITSGGERVSIPISQWIEK